MKWPHRIMVVTHEEGKITLDEYLERVVFYQKRDFTPEHFRDFMFSLTSPNRDMIGLITNLKEKYKLKIIVFSNEAREMNEYRIQKFQLNNFVDFFISSCFVHLRKPDAAIFHMAIDGAQVPVEEIVYIDDGQMFVDIASDLGITSIRHTDYLSTAAALAKLGLQISEEEI